MNPDRLSRTPFRLLTLVLLAGTLSACAPSLSPLYRDYEALGTESTGPDRIQDLRTAFQEAGWELAPSTAANVVATQTKTLNHWGLYKVVVSLEAALLGDGFVRLYAHPYRIYFTGNRSKIPYLGRSVARSILPKLNAAFETRGFVLVGTAVSRDRIATWR